MFHQLSGCIVGHLWEIPVDYALLSDEHNGVLGYVSIVL